MADVWLGDYYYQVDCVHCKQVGPLIKRINRNLVDAYIREVQMTARWQSQKPHRLAEDFERGAWFRFTEQYSPAKKTPAVYWKDGVYTQGLPFDGEELKLEEAREYLCRRVARLYLEERIPAYEVPPEEIDDVLEQVWDAWSRRQTKDGDVYSPYQVLHELSARYAV